jgi:hypothetical protein
VEWGDGLVLHFREITPKDFYLGQILRQQKRSFMELVVRLLLSPEECLDQIPARKFSTVVKWVTENLLEERLFTVENWLKTAFHLCKERWDSSIDWMESQPISKVLTMISVTNDFHEKQADEAKKAARRKK